MVMWCLLMNHIDPHGFVESKLIEIDGARNEKKRIAEGDGPAIIDRDHDLHDKLLRKESRRVEAEERSLYFVCVMCPTTFILD